MKVDAHLHLWDLATGDYGWNTPDLGPAHATVGPAEAAAALRSGGVDAAVLVQAADTVGDTERMLEVARSHPWVAGVVGWVPLTEPDRAAELLDRWSEDPRFCGVRQLLHDHPDPDLLDAPAVRRTLRRLADRGVPLDVPDAWPRLWPALRRLVAELPELTVVLDHLGKPALRTAGPAGLASWSADLRELAAHPQVVAKLSGLGALPVGPSTGSGNVPADPSTGSGNGPGTTVGQVVDVALDAFGTGRLMIGSDWPLCLVHGSYASGRATLLAAVAELSPDERADLTGRTATEVYGLSPATGAASSPPR